MPNFGLGSPMSWFPEILTSTIASGEPQTPMQHICVGKTRRQASGKFVRSDRGYMIAYDQLIPGTHEIIA